MTKFYLTWTTTHDDVETLPLESAKIVVGRMSDCDLVLSSPFVSRHHAKLVQSGKGYSIVDLNSSGGTALNGQSIQEQKLQPMDRIRLGQSGVELRYMEEEGTKDETRLRSENLLVSVLTTQVSLLSWN